jgi:mannosyltransferase
MMSAITLAHKSIRAVPIAPIVGLVVAVGLALRLYTIGEKSLWIDESFSIWTASQPLDALWRFTVQLDQHPPLYYTLLHFWLALGDSETIVRGFSALWGVLMLPIMYLISERVGGRALGLLSTLLLAISPLHIWFAQQARMYTMLTFFAGMAILCMLHLIEEQTGDRRQETGDNNVGRSVLMSLASRLVSYRWWMGFVVFTTLTMLGHNTAVFFPVAAGLFAAGAFGIPALYRRLRPTNDQRPTTNDQRPSNPISQPPTPSPQRQLWTWTTGLGVALLLWLPWLPSFLIQSRRVDNEFWIQPPTVKSVLEHWRNLGSAFAPGGALLVPLVLAFVGLALLGAWRLRRRPAVLLLLVLLLLVPFAGSLLVSLRRPIFYTRTLIWTSIPLYVLMAAGLLQMRWRALIGIAMLLLVLLNAGSLWGYYRYYEPEDWRGVAGYVASEAEPGDLLLFNAGWMQIPFDYYYRRVGAPLEEHGLPADLFDRGILEPKMTRADIPRLDELVAGQGRVWLMYSHDWYTDPQRIIPRHLDSTLGEISVRDFKGVKVYLYQGR